MANLTAIKEKIKNISDYSPQLAAYNDQLDDLINDAYYTIWTMRRWTFGFKEYYFRFHPDMLPKRENPGGADINASVTKGSRQVTFSGLMDRLVPDLWEGQPIQIQNYEYIISKVVSSNQILLDRQFLGDTNIDDDSWRIKHRFYSLPEDCIELLSLGHRDVPNSSGGTGRFPPYGKIIGLMPRRDEELDLRMDYTATYAEAYIWSEAKNIPSGEKISLEFGSKVDNTGFVDGTYLEVCWAFVKDHLVGPLSKPETIYFKNTEQAPPSYSLSVKFVSWDDQTIVADSFQTKDVMPTQWEGYRKVIFWNANFNRATGERLGLPVWKTFNQGGTTRNTTQYLSPVVVEDTLSTVTVNFLNQIDNGNKRYIEYDGQHLQIRPYPRVDAWDSRILDQAATADYSKVNLQYLREGVARYYYKPQALGLQTDSPELPNEFHQLISYKVLETLYDKLGNMNNASLYRSRFEKEVKGLERRYVNHIDSMMVRGQFVLGGWDSRMRYDVNSLRKLS
jgi:hypothetical protein